MIMTSTSTSTIVWNEGMFIAPQHFHHNHLSVQNYINEIVQLDLSFGDYGVSKLDMDPDLLNIGKVGLRMAEGVFPDRLFFKLSKELVLDIPDGTVGEIIFLAVPLSVFGVAQFGDGSEPVRFVKSMVKLRDLNDPNNETIETEIAEIGAHLILESTEKQGYAIIPIAKVLEKNPEGRIILDTDFVPHVLRISASSALMDSLEKIISLMWVRSVNAASRIQQDKKTRSESSLIVERLELQVLNRWLVILQNVLHTGKSTPRKLFEYMSCLLAELCGLMGQTASENLIYNSEKIASSFESVLLDLRQKLILEKPVSVVALNWNTELFEKRRLLRLVIPPHMIKDNRTPILSLSSIEKEVNLSEIGPLACKLGGLSAIPELVIHGLPGITITPLSVPPTQLRSRSDATFFAIDVSSPHWGRFIEKSEALALHIDDRIQGIQAKLYMLEQT